jgi:hypothetical protein
MGVMKKRQSLPIEPFSTRSEWKQWLLKNYSRSNGIWLQIFKKHAGKISTTYDEALDEGGFALAGQMARKKSTTRRPGFRSLRPAGR